MALAAELCPCPLSRPQSLAKALGTFIKPVESTWFSKKARALVKFDHTDLGNSRSPVYRKTLWVPIRDQQMYVSLPLALMGGPEYCRAPVFGS